MTQETALPADAEDDGAKCTLAYSAQVKRRRRLAFSNFMGIRLSEYGATCELAAACCDSLGYVRIVSMPSLLGSQSPSLDEASTQEWMAHRGGTNALALASGLQVLASGGRDGCVRVWAGDAAASESSQDPQTSHPEALARDLLRAECRVSDGAAPALLGGRASAEVLSLDSMGTDTLAAGCANGNVHVLSLGGAELRVSRTLQGHLGAVVEVSGNPTSPHLAASASADGTVRLWDLRAAQPCTATFYPAAPRAGPPPKGGAAAGVEVALPQAPGVGVRAADAGTMEMLLDGDIPLPGGMLTCCSWDVTGSWVLAGTRGGLLCYYHCAAGTVAGSVQLPHAPLALEVAANEVYIGVDAPMLCHSAFMAESVETLPIAVPCAMAIASQQRKGERLGVVVLASLYGSLQVLSSSSYRSLATVLTAES